MYKLKKIFSSKTLIENNKMTLNILDLLWLRNTLNNNKDLLGENGLLKVEEEKMYTSIVNGTLNIRKYYQEIMYVLNRKFLGYVFLLYVTVGASGLYMVMLPGSNYIGNLCICVYYNVLVVCISFYVGSMGIGIIGVPMNSREEALFYIERIFDRSRVRFDLEFIPLTIGVGLNLCLILVFLDTDLFVVLVLCIIFSVFFTGYVPVVKKRIGNLYEYCIEREEEVVVIDIPESSVCVDIEEEEKPPSYDGGN